MHQVQAQVALDLLKKYNLISDEQNTIMSAEVKQDKPIFRGLQNEQFDRDKERKENKANAEEMRKVRADIAQAERDQAGLYEQLRGETQNNFKIKRNN